MAGSWRRHWAYGWTGNPAGRRKSDNSTGVPFNMVKHFGEYPLGYFHLLGCFHLLELVSQATKTPRCPGSALAEVGRRLPGCLLRAIFSAVVQFLSLAFKVFKALLSLSFGVPFIEPFLYRATIAVPSPLVLGSEEKPK